MQARRHCVAKHHVKAGKASWGQPSSQFSRVRRSTGTPGTQHKAWRYQLQCHILTMASVFIAATVLIVASLTHPTAAACDRSRIMAWKWSSVTGAYSIMIAQPPADCPCNSDPTPLFANPNDPVSPTRPSPANPGPWPSNLARVCSSMGNSITAGVVTNAGWCSVRGCGRSGASTPLFLS